MANLPVISLNAGKFTPLIDARSDIEKYTSGCRILENMIPLIYGPVIRRPGTKKIADVDDHDVKSRMVTFKFSATIAYKLEFSDKILNVYFEETLIKADIVTPYLEADLFQLQFEQSADVLWITHPSYLQRKLSRVAVDDFSLDTITFDKGPFRERNDIIEKDDVTITVTGFSTGVTFDSGTKTITFTTTTDLSSLFPVNQRLYVTNATASTNDGAYTVASTTWTTPTQTVVVNETLASDTDGGQIMVDGGTVTLAASASVFITGDEGHTGALFKLTHKRTQTSIVGTATGTEVIGNAIDAKGSWTLTSKGNWGGEFEIQRLADGTNWETFRTYASALSAGQGSFNAQKTHIEKDDGVQYRISATITGGTLEIVFGVDASTQDSIFRITAVASTQSATATAVIAAPDNVAAKRWAEGSWSNVRGYPAAVTFFEERIVYGFSNLDAQNIWLSRTGRFEEFDTGILDNDPFTLTLPTADHGRWLGSLDALAAGTTGGEWRIRSSREDEALTPKNWSMKEQTTFGSTDIQAMEVNDAIIFIDSVARKIREFTWNDVKQKFASPDLTALAEDITSGGITSLAIQKHPDSIIWFTIANSPYLISMTYEREQNVVALAEHPLGGSGIAESICVTRGSSEDVITLTAKWTINSNTRRYIIDMQPRDWGSITNAVDSFFVDAGIVDTSGSTTISGLDHLEGKTVAVLVDGAVQASQVVSGGQITITEAGDRVAVGLPYEYRVSPMRPDITIQSGTTHGSIMKISEIVLSLFASGGVKFGDGTDQVKIDFRTTEDYGGPPDLFTGDTAGLAFDGAFSQDVNFVISGSDPLPCTVRAIIPRIQKTGR